MVMNFMFRKRYSVLLALVVVLPFLTMASSEAQGEFVFEVTQYGSPDIVALPLNEENPTVRQSDLRWTNVDRALRWFENLGLHRFLQTNSSSVTPLNVNLICSAYNTVYNCSCARSGKLDAYIECNTNRPFCRSDNSTCWVQRFTTILDAMAVQSNQNVPSKVLTTCTKQIDFSPKLNRSVVSLETCIEVQPQRSGVFNESLLCGAAVDSKLCNSCKRCPSQSGDNTSKITVDCCNVAKDAYMTCGVVTNNGLSTPIWDPAGSHPSCKGSNAHKVGGMWLLQKSAVLVASTWCILEIIGGW